MIFTRLVESSWTPSLRGICRSARRTSCRRLLLSNLGKHFEALLDKVLLDHSENLVLLESLTRDVQKKILRIHDTLDKNAPFWHELIAVIHDEDPRATTYT